MNNKSIRDYINLIENAQQSVAEGELTTYLVSVMDASTKEHWRIEVKVTSPEAARERAEAMGYKVLGVKEKPGVAEGLDDIVKGVKRKIKGKEHPEVVASKHFGRALGHYNQGEIHKAEKEIKRFNKIQSMNKGTNASMPNQLGEQGVAEEQLEETTPEAIEKVEQLVRK